MKTKYKVESVFKLLSSGIDSERIVKPVCLSLLLLKHISYKKLDLNVWQKWILDDLDNPQIIESIYKAFEYATNQLVETKLIFEDIEIRRWNQKLNNLKQALRLLDSIDCSKPSFLGDAYENMMNFKFGGEFYTPSCLCKLMSQLALFNNPNPEKIYDPTCGTGGLLMAIYRECEIKPQVYGQELNQIPFRLALGNCLIHEVNSYSIELGDTLSDPKHTNVKFDIVIANPPFSVRWNQIEDERFKAYSLAPKTKADLAFVIHSLYHLKDNGTLVTVAFPGIFYRTGKEQAIRKELIENNLVDCIIALDEGLFLNTTISVNILILKKNRSHDSVFFINASNLSLDKQGKQRFLKEDHIQQILDTYKTRKNVSGFSNSISRQKIIEEDFNLNPARYVTQEDENRSMTIEEYSILSRKANEASIRQITSILWTSLYFYKVDQELSNLYKDESFMVLDETLKLCEDIKRSLEQNTWNDDVIKYLERKRKEREI